MTNNVYFLKGSLRLRNNGGASWPYDADGPP